MRSQGTVIFLSLFLVLGCGNSRSEKESAGSESEPAKNQPFCGDREILDSVQLDVSRKMQECEDWCWAAAISMISDYYGRPASECGLATLRFGNMHQCCTGSACNLVPCNQPAGYRDVGRLLKQSAGIYSRFLPRPLTEQEIQLELSNGRPIIVGFSGVTSSHVAVVTGFERGRGNEASAAVYTVFDPSLGTIILDYKILREGPTDEEFLPWLMSWTRLSPRPDGCNERFDPLCGCETSP